MGREVDEWDRCRKYLDLSVYHETQSFTMEDLAIGIKAGYYQLWPSENAAAVTGTFLLKDGGECVQVMAAGGEYDEVMELLDQIETVARRGGAEALMTVGRIGWRKEAKIREWDHVASIFYKRLEH